MGKKSEAREKRKQKKLADFEAAKPAIISKVIQDTQPRRVIDPAISGPRIAAGLVTTSSGTPKAIESGSNHHLTLTWCVTQHDSEWTWKNVRTWTEQEWSETVLPAFERYQTLTWREIDNLTYNGKDGSRRKLAHYQDVVSMASEAQSRWIVRDLEEFDTAFRFRLGTNRRVWGVVVGAHFFIVWWDPNHEICPTD